MIYALKASGLSCHFKLPTHTSAAATAHALPHHGAVRRVNSTAEMAEMARKSLGMAGLLFAEAST